MPFTRVGLVLLLATSAAAQVYVVDANNGAGTNFTDLPPAVAAVPDGAVLRVRAGTYTPFTLQNKGLRIVGEASVTLDRSLGHIAIGPTTAAQVVVLRNLLLPVYGVRVTDAAGPVVVEQCRRHPFLGFVQASDFELTRAANVQIHECVLVDHVVGTSQPTVPAIAATDATLQVSRSSIAALPGDTALQQRAAEGNPAVRLVRSRCVAVASSISGGDGGPGCRSCGLPGCGSDGGHGGPAVLSLDSTVILLGTTVTGGAGGRPGCCQTQCTCGGNGGPGLRLSTSSVAALGTQPAGGAAGGGASFCYSLPGVPIETTGQNHVVRDPAAQPPSAHLTGAQARGQTVSFTAYAPAGSLALLTLSYRGDLAPLDALGIWGSLLGSTALTLGPVLVGAGNSAVLPVALPPTLPLGEVYFGQFVTLANQRLFVSNAFPLLAID